MTNVTTVTVTENKSFNCTITGLTNGTAYKIFYAAKNTGIPPYPTDVYGQQLTVSGSGTSNGGGGTHVARLEFIFLIALIAFFMIL